MLGQVLCLLSLLLGLARGKPPDTPIPRSAPQIGRLQVQAAASVAASVLGSLALAGQLRSQARENGIDQSMHAALFSRIPSGAVLEVGFGGGANLDYYPRGVVLTGIDPLLSKDYANPQSQSVVRRYAQRDIPLSLQQGVCEALPFGDATFDCVVSTLVFCSVADPLQSLREVARVLRPGGLFLCVEHVLGEDGSFLQAQHRLLDPLQQILADGCHLTRTTDQLLIANTMNAINTMNTINTNKDISNTNTNAGANIKSTYTNTDNSNTANAEVASTDTGTVGGYKETVGGYLFREALSVKYVQLGSQWPIERQVYGAFRR